MKIAGEISAVIPVDRSDGVRVAGGVSRGNIAGELFILLHARRTQVFDVMLQLCPGFKAVLASDVKLGVGKGGLGPLTGAILP